MLATAYLSVRAMRAIDNGADVDFVAYLVGRIMERRAEGRSQDCDEYRELLRLS